MAPGDIILVAFPFVDLPVSKARPAIFVRNTTGKFMDSIVVPLSTSYSTPLSNFEILIEPSKTNHLKVNSMIMVDRLFTVRESWVIDTIGKLNKAEFQVVKQKLQELFK